MNTYKQQAYAYQTVHFHFLNHDYTEEDEKYELNLKMFISLIKQQAYAYQTVHFRFLNHDYTE